MSLKRKKRCKLLKFDQPGVDTEARWVKKGDISAFGYKQHTLVDDNGLVMAVKTTTATNMTANLCVVIG